jgi:pimeloyl-ACP methyl ester carboxylesterase
MITKLGDRPALGPDDLRAITRRCLIAVGDRDAMVTLAETSAAARGLASGECLVLPGTPHPLEQVPMDPLLFHLRRFFTPEP